MTIQWFFKTQGRKRPCVILMKIATILMAALMAASGSYAQPETDILDQVILLDMQGLGGGTDLWISKDGRAVCRFVKPPAKGELQLQETIYSFKISGEQHASLYELVKKYDFWGIESSDRYGVPDESRPVIFMKSGDKIHAAAKWANDKHMKFDPIYMFLLNIARSGKDGTIIRKATYDRNWGPDGFQSNKSVRDMTIPKPDKN